MSAETVAAGLKLGAKFGEVVTLAVVNDPSAAIFVEDGLMASGEIDDREAAHAKASAVGHVNSLIVRYTICWHMWCTRASVMVLSRVALTTPAIPHMVLTYSLAFQTQGHTTGLLCHQRHIGKPLETIVAVIAGIAVAAVGGGKEDVRHLTRSDKVQLFVPVRCAAGHRCKKVAEAVADHRIFLRRIHAMAMQFDEQPVGTPEYADPRLLPERQTAYGRGIGSGDGTVLEKRPGRTQRAPEVGHERTLDHQREGAGRAPCNQVVSLAVWRCLIKRQSAFVNGIDFFDLRRMPEAARHGQVGVAAGLG